MTRIKICGLMRPADVEAVNAARPDFAGFVVDVPASRRSVTPADVRVLAPQLAAGIRAVGVFVDAPPQLVAALLNNGTLYAAQLHGSEDAAYVASLRALTDKPLVQAFRVASAADVARAAASAADLVLLDSGAGSGRTFDWRLARACPRPFFLAGGLAPGTIAAAVAAARPAGVDLSSGVETNGVKDFEKIAQAVAEAHGVGAPEDETTTRSEL